MRLWSWSAEDGNLSKAVTTRSGWEDQELLRVENERDLMGGGWGSCSAPGDLVDGGAIPVKPGNGAGPGLKPEPMFSLRCAVFESQRWGWQGDGRPGGLGAKICCLGELKPRGQRRSP